MANPPFPPWSKFCPPPTWRPSCIPPLTGPLDPPWKPVPCRSMHTVNISAKLALLFNSDNLRTPGEHCTNVWCHLIFVDDICRETGPDGTSRGLQKGARISPQQARGNCTYHKCCIYIVSHTLRFNDKSVHCFSLRASRSMSLKVVVVIVVVHLFLLGYIAKYVQNTRRYSYSIHYCWMYQIQLHAIKTNTQKSIIKYYFNNQGRTWSSGSECLAFYYCLIKLVKRIIHIFSDNPMYLNNRTTSWLPGPRLIRKQ